MKTAPGWKNHDFVSIMLIKAFVKVSVVYGVHKKWMVEILHAFGLTSPNFTHNKTNVWYHII